MLAQGGVALTDSADASRCYPDLWGTPAAARQAFYRRRRVTDPDGELPEGQCHAPLRRATYQRAGAGKRPATLSFDPSAMPVDRLRSWLEERVGPLARFELDPQRRQPDPPQAEPPGAPGTKSGSEAREHQGTAAFASAETGACGSLSDLECQPAVGGGCGPAAPAMTIEPAKSPPEAVSDPGGGDALPEAVEAPPGPSVAPQAPICPGSTAGGLPAELQAVQVLQQRRRLAALAERLQDSKPKRTHAMRELDRQAYQDAAREAAGLPSDAWWPWRSTFGTAAAGWPPRPPGPPSNAGAHR